MILKIAALFCLLQATAYGELASGTEFIFAFPCNSPSAIIIPYLFAYNANLDVATVTITSSLTSDIFNTTTVDVIGESIKRISFSDIASAAFAVCDYGLVANKGVLVRSTLPITLYVDMELLQQGSATHFLVYPTNMLSTQYNYWSSSDTQSYALIVAIQDNTKFTIGANAQTLTLNKLQAYMIQTSSASIKLISANVPFASVSFGSYRSSTAAVMSLPSTYSSMGFPLAFFNEQQSGRATIFGLFDNTTVTYNGHTKITLNAGDSQLISGLPSTYINATRPVQVIYDDYYSNQYIGYGIAPENFLNRSVQFYPLGPVGDSQPKTILIIAPLLSVGKIAIDDANSPISALKYRRIQYSGSDSSHSYYYYSESIAAGVTHSVIPTDIGVHFLATVFSNGAQFVVNFDMPPPPPPPTTPPPPSCPGTDWIINRNACYKVFYEQLTWENAEKKCGGVEAHLTSITSQSENDFITAQTISGASSPQPYWIGLSTLADGQHFSWNDASSTSFMNWAPEQPSQSTGLVCATLAGGSGGNGQWSSASCYDVNVRSYICKKA